MTLSEKGKKELIASDTVRINDTMRLPAVTAQNLMVIFKIG